MPFSLKPLIINHFITHRERSLTCAPSHYTAGDTSWHHLQSDEHTRVNMSVRCQFSKECVHDEWTGERLQSKSNEVSFRLHLHLQVNSRCIYMVTQQPHDGCACGVFTYTTYISTTRSQFSALRGDTKTPSCTRSGDGAVAACKAAPGRLKGHLCQCLNGVPGVSGRADGLGFMCWGFICWAFQWSISMQVNGNETKRVQPHARRPAHRVMSNGVILV